MQITAQAIDPTAIRTDLGAIFVSMELSRSKWLITSISPGNGEKMSKHILTAGDVAGLLALFQKLRERSRVNTGHAHQIITIQEAGLDGFWIHRVLEGEGFESHVVDPASIAISRRRRRAKTDRIDGEALLRGLMAYKRGEPRVCDGAGGQHFRTNARLGGGRRLVVYARDLGREQHDRSDFEATID
jgi:transposase